MRQTISSVVKAQFVPLALDAAQINACLRIPFVVESLIVTLEFIVVVETIVVFPDRQNVALANVVNHIAHIFTKMRPSKEHEHIVQLN